MQFLVDMGIEDADLPRLVAPRGKPSNNRPELRPISGKDGIDKLESAYMLLDTTLQHIYKMQERTRSKWRFDITSAPIPIRTSYPGMVEIVPRSKGPYPDDYGPDYNPTLDTFPLLPDTISHPLLKIIYWNSGRWNSHKAIHLANLAGQNAADIILISNMQTNFFRCESLIEALADRLGISTGKQWMGIPSPNRYRKKGGAFVLFSGLILKPKVTHHLPYGKLTNLSGGWNGRDFDILSAFRPLTDNIPKGSVVTEKMH